MSAAERPGSNQNTAATKLRKLQIELVRQHYIALQARRRRRRRGECFEYLVTCFYSLLDTILDVLMQRVCGLSMATWLSNDQGALYASFNAEPVLLQCLLLEPRRYPVGAVEAMVRMHDDASSGWVLDNTSGVSMDELYLARIRRAVCAIRSMGERSQPALLEKAYFYVQDAYEWLCPGAPVSEIKKTCVDGLSTPEAASYVAAWTLDVTRVCMSLTTPVHDALRVARSMLDFIVNNNGNGGGGGGPHHQAGGGARPEDLLRWYRKGVDVADELLAPVSFTSFDDDAETMWKIFEARLAHSRMFVILSSEDASGGLVSAMLLLGVVTATTTTPLQCQLGDSINKDARNAEALHDLLLIEGPARLLQAAVGVLDGYLRLVEALTLALPPTTMIAPRLTLDALGDRVLFEGPAEETVVARIVDLAESAARILRQKQLKTQCLPGLVECVASPDNRLGHDWAYGRDAGRHDRRRWALYVIKNVEWACGGCGGEAPPPSVVDRYWYTDYIVRTEEDIITMDQRTRRVVLGHQLGIAATQHVRASDWRTRILGWQRATAADFAAALWPRLTEGEHEFVLVRLAEQQAGIKIGAMLREKEHPNPEVETRRIIDETIQRMLDGNDDAAENEPPRDIFTLLGDVHSVVRFIYQSVVLLGIATRCACDVYRSVCGDVYAIGADVSHDAWRARGERFGAVLQLPPEVPGGARGFIDVDDDGAAAAGPPRRPTATAPEAWTDEFAKATSAHISTILYRLLNEDVADVGGGSTQLVGRTQVLVELVLAAVWPMKAAPVVVFGARDNRRLVIPPVPDYVSKLPPSAPSTREEYMSAIGEVKKYAPVSKEAKLLNGYVAAVALEGGFPKQKDRVAFLVNLGAGFGVTQMVPNALFRRTEAELSSFPLLRRLHACVSCVSHAADTKGIAKLLTRSELVGDDGSKKVSNFIYMLLWSAISCIPDPLVSPPVEPQDDDARFLWQKPLGQVSWVRLFVMLSETVEFKRVCNNCVSPGTFSLEDVKTLGGGVKRPRKE